MSEKNEELDIQISDDKIFEITLEYGDIIGITAPRNIDIHEHTFFITYINKTVIKLTDVTTLLLHELNIAEDGQLTDESIEIIELLSRADEKGYARQNGLTPKKWVNVYFDGDFPIILNGEITNLEEDMIELTTYPDLDVIYIDFEYKGLPKHIPIQTIQISKKPDQLAKTDTLESLRGEYDENQSIASIEMTDSGESIISIPENALPDKNIRDALHSLYIDANDIIFGEEEDEIVQVVEIAEKEKKYTIETQVNSLMDELLSTIPNSQRTKEVLENIHRIIIRFKELRVQFSNFDENHNISGPKLVGPNYKPIIDHIKNMDVNLKWLLPVIQSKTKLYTDTPIDNVDVISISNDIDLKEQSLIQEDYYENKTKNDNVKFKEMLKRTNPYMTPYESVINESTLYNGDIQTNIDTIVNNLENFESTIIRKNEIAKRKFVIRRYNMACSMMEPQVLKTGRKVFLRKNMYSNDNMSIKSFITLPQSIMKYSKTGLPCTSIMERSSLALNPPLLFRILKSKTNIDQFIVEQFKTEIDYEKMEEETKLHFLSTMKEYVLDDALTDENDKLENFLKVIIPNSRNLIRLVRPYIQDKLSIVEIVKELEPFMVYIEDITYKQYMEIRYFIKERISEFKKAFAQNLIDFSIIRTTKYNVLPLLHGIERIIHDMKPVLDIFIDGYKFDHLKQTKHLRTTFDSHPSELLSNIIKMDNGRLLSNLISSDKLSLTIPDHFLDTMTIPSIGDMGRIEKIKANDCIRRVLVKRYTLLKDLQKDNQEVIEYDTEFDDSPYEILKKYKNEQTKMAPENFVDFLTEILIAKHDYPVNLAGEMSKTLILGKRHVVDGEYAVLVLKPQLPSNIDKGALSSGEKDAIRIEEDANKITHYYRRIKTNWIRDESIDETTFIDNNTLFCNMSKVCFKNTSNDVCEPMQTAADRMKIIAKRKLVLEADSRYEKSVDEMKQEFNTKIEYFMKSIIKNNALKDVQLYKYNNYAFELGNLAVTDEIIQSPYIKLRDFIVAQDDFSKRQSDINRFVKEFTREPLVAELNENAYWLYCKETNTKLLPSMLYKLAMVYLDGQNYQSALDELCRTQGVLSDDGDSIIDKYSGEVIKKLDFSTDEGFDESGFKMTTHEIMQKDLKTVVEEALQNKDKIFENETTQTIYNIFMTLCENLGIPSNGMEDLIIRLTVEIVETNIKKEPAYEAFSEKMEKQKGKRPIAYKLYRHQTIIMMVAAVLLIGLQTATPGYKPKITTPGCIRSFSGFPLNGGEEDSTGLQYIACTVNKTKSAISPWNSIKQMPLQIINKGIRQILTEILIIRPDISEMYIKKREYILLHPDEVIPEEHNIVKWQGFLPPVVQYSVKKSLRNVSSDMKSELIELMQNGNKHQHEILNVFKSKILMYGYGVIELINEIVSKKDVLLKTSANIPFLQNACCGDRNTVNALTYFMDEAPEIDQYLKIINNLSEIVVNTKELTQAPILFHPLNTTIVRPIIPTIHFDTNIYAAFIYYCRFDRNIPVPAEFQKICNERPAGYNSNWSLEEKIKFLKENGKRFTIDQLYQLMEIVYNKNQIPGPVKNTFSKIDSLREILEFLDEKESNIIDKKLIECLLNVITEHNPSQFVMEDTKSTETLKNYLSISNSRMYDAIYSFIDKFGNLNDSHLNKLDDFISNVVSWTIDRSPGDGKLYYEEGMYSISQFIKNSVYSMTRIFPEMIINNVEINTVPKHWNLSQFHKQDVSRFIQKYYEPIQKFKKDKTIVLLLREIQDKLIDVNIFIQQLPIYTPIHKDQNTFYSLFDKQTIYMLLKYIWYSVLYEYITLSDDTELLQVDVEENKMTRRAKIRERSDIVETLQTVYEDDIDDNAIDYMKDLSEIEISINIGNLQDFKHRTAQLLTAFLDIELDNKQGIDLTYNKISEKINRSKQNEKKMITDFFRDMDSDERRVQNLEKTYKMGRWNVGMQKGLVQYDKSTYDRERGEIIEQLNNTADIDDDVAIMQREIYEIEQDEAAEIEAEYENEANDIGDLADDYMDNYENNDDDDFGRES